jgi:hypothetical protein
VDQIQSCFTGSGGSTLLWYDASSGGSLLDTGLSIVYYASSTDTLYLQNGLVCPSARIEVPVIVNPLPSVDLGEDTTIFSPQTITLDAGSGFDLYAWSTGDTTQTYLAISSGHYSVAVTDSNGCVGYDTIFVTVITGIEEQEASMFRVYPNPSQGKLFIECREKMPAYEISLVDAKGRIVFSKGYVSNGAGNVELSLGQMPSGVLHTTIADWCGDIQEKDTYPKQLSRRPSLRLLVPLKGKMSCVPYWYSNIS